MILVDSSIWVDHFRRKDERLYAMLVMQHVMTHPMIIGELSLGSLPKRKEIIESLQNLPQAVTANDAEVMTFIERHTLYSMGIGYIDVHVLASAKLSAVKIWTKDKRLHEAAGKLGLAYYT